MNEKEREEKILEIITMLEEELGKDKEFFERYNPILEKMNLKELEEELELIKNERKTSE